MRLSVAVIHPYWDFWESSVAGSLRADRSALLQRASDHLAGEFDVVASALVSSSAEASATLQDCAAADAIVIISSMAVPPSTGMALLSVLPGTPVVIWAVSDADSLPAGFSHSDITSQGATVGAPMLASALARAGRPFDLVVSTLETPARIDGAVRSAAAAGRVRQARVLSIGEHIPGYTTVVPPAGTIEGLGPTIVHVKPEDLVRLTSEVPERTVGEFTAQVTAQFAIDTSVDSRALDQVVRAEAALRTLISQNRASAGALNCHVAALRPNADFGVAPCLALGRLTTEGIPWTCTGDVLTAIAMLAVQSLGHPTLYHEIEAVDHTTNEAILANTGEHDLRLLGEDQAELVPNVWYPNDPLAAPCARFSIPLGPASLVGFVYAPEARFVVAEGAFTGRTSPATGTPNAGFRFASGPVGEAWARWGRAGVLHHSAATNAHVATEIERLAHHMGVSFISV
jgi:L-arabinose isomerase